MSFLNQFYGFKNWPSILIIFEDDIAYIPNNKESTGIWHDLVMEICKISLLDILNEPLIRGKKLGRYTYDTFKQTLEK